MGSLSPAMRETAQVMAWELESTRLRVGLAPSQVSGREWRRRIRVVEETNPEWYQRFCLEHSDSLRTRPRKRKKPDTYIKRAHTLRALNEIASGRAATEYAQRLMPYVLNEAKRYEREINRHHPGPHQERDSFTEGVVTRPHSLLQGRHTGQSPESVALLPEWSEAIRE